MPRLSAVVSVARLCGLAPYQRRGGDYVSSGYLVAASVALVAVAAGVTLVLHHWAVAAMRTELFLAEAVGEALMVLYAVSALAGLLLRQYPRLGRILAAPQLPAAAERTSPLPAVAELVLVLLFNSAPQLAYYLLPAEEQADTCVLAWFSVIPLQVVCLGNKCLFTFLLTILSTLFEEIKEDLTSVMQKYSVEKFGDFQHVSNDVAVIRTLRSKHKQVRELTGLVSDCFGWQMMFVLLMEFWWVVTIVFASVHTFHTGQYLAFLPFFLELLFTVSSVVVLAVIAGSTSCKGNQILADVHGFINSEKISEKLRWELKLFADQISQERVSVELAGSTRLDTNLLLCAGSAAVTYVIILHEFPQTTAYSTAPPI